MTDFAGLIKNTVAICWLALLGQWAAAVEVPNLFRESVAVDNQSPRQRQLAATEALAIVLVRISGTETVLRNEDVRAALSRADRYLGQFGYQSRSDSAVGDDGAAFELMMEFQPKPVIELLKQAGQPLWSKNRPAILACITLADGSSRKLLTQSGAGASASLEQWNALVADEAQRRGLPIRLPASGAECASQASAPSAELILRGDLRLVGASCVAEWSLPFEGRERQWKFGTDTPQPCVAKAVDAVAETMSASYAFAAVGESQAPLVLQVADISDFSVYSDVILMLKGLAMVESVDVASVDHNTVDFSLQIQGDVDKLQQAIRLKHLLQEVPAPAPAPAPAKATAPAVEPVPETGLDPAAAPAPAPVLPVAEPKVRLYYRMSST